MFARRTLLTSFAFAAFSTSLIAADWITAPSDYTHDPDTGERVAQFAPIAPVYVESVSNYVRSGYRNYRSTIQAGGSADNYHLVEEWGRPVIPYEQWRFPFRPYGSPYQAWGPPFAGAGGGGFYPGYGGPWGGWGGGGAYGGGGSPAYPYYQPNGPTQSTDGYYPTYDRHDRSDYYRPYTPQGGHHHNPW